MTDDPSAPTSTTPPTPATPTPFTIRGMRIGGPADPQSGERPLVPAWVTWSVGGAITGSDEDIVAQLREMARQLDGTLVKPLVGPASLHDHLSNPYAAAVLMRRLFVWNPRPVQEGSLPLLPPPPAGAIQ